MPKIYVEATGPTPGYRITMPDGSRENINGYKWGRKEASRILDIAEHVYKIKRRNVRFIIK